MGKIKPIQFVVLSYLLVISIGALILCLPVSSKDGEFTPFIDALFTATSATCVTGLVVRDTGTYWSLFGQLVILILIQVGGLGYMTIATFFPLILGRKVGLIERIRLAETLNISSLKGIMLLAKYVFFTVVFLEGLGAVFLFLRFISLMPLFKAAYFAVFHSVSAFCNAGFDLMGSFSGPFSSLTFFKGDVLVNLTVCTLIICGGIGFPVIVNLVRHWRKKEALELHTKLVLRFTAILLILGTFVIFGMEFQNPHTLGQLPLGEKLLSSFFQAVTPRTAGFNTLDIRSMNVGTLMFIVILMFIGASPGGTGGGVKTSSIGVILATIKSTVRGYSETVLWGKQIPPYLVRKAFSIVALSFFLVCFVAICLSVVEPFHFTELLFETTSGFGTVGLSTGITPSLTIPGKLFIIFTVFSGRVGVLTLVTALILKRKETRIGYPQEELIVG
ncbi:MAG: TrkH family potassium uptake protein [Caldiserica bacterium]|nr:TrkH family potassium uptake protein [Caldisericota bacterium]MDH7562469.1 TrkH family potassium uptake protein [Caldisericota bacterium]